MNHFQHFWTFKNYEVMISVERYFSYLSTGIVSYFFVATCLVRNCLKKVGHLLVDPGLLTHLQLSLCRNLRSNFQLIVKNLLQICNSYRKRSLQFIEKPVSFYSCSSVWPHDDWGSAIIKPNQDMAMLIEKYLNDFCVVVEIINWGCRTVVVVVVVVTLLFGNRYVFHHFTWDEFFTNCTKWLRIVI